MLIAYLYEVQADLMDRTGVGKLLSHVHCQRGESELVSSGLNTSRIYLYNDALYFFSNL